MTTSIIPAAVSSQLDNTGEERIHIANIVPGGVVRTAFVPSFDSVFISQQANTQLYYSLDAPVSAFTTVETGGTFSGGGVGHLFFANGRMFHTRIANRTRSSTDNSSWVGTTGFNPGGSIGTLLHDGSQYVAYCDFDTNRWVSANGTSWSAQAMGFTASSPRFATKGSSVVGLVSTANTIRLSTDGGVSFSAVDMGGTVTTFQNRFPLATANRFIVFGVNNASPFQTMLKWSTTGAAGTWTEVNLPIGTFSGPHLWQAAVNTDTGRIIAVYSNGAVYYSDDEGSTWTAGTSLLNSQSDLARTRMIYSPRNGRMYYLGFYNDGGAINEDRLYSSPDGVQAWTLHYSNPASNPGLLNIAVMELP